MSCAWKRALKWFTACGHLSDNNLKRPRFFDMTCAIKLQPDEKKNETVKWARVAHPHTVRCVGTLHRSRSSSLSCRLQCLASSFFTPPPTPPGKERGCVCLCEKHTWQRGRPKTPPLHRPTSSPPLLIPSPSPHPTSTLSAPPTHHLTEPPQGGEGSVKPPPAHPVPVSPPHLLSPPLHPTFFPSPPRGEMDLCLGLVMSLLATWGFGVQRSESGELSRFLYSARRLWYTHVKVETVFVYSSGIVYSLRSGPFIVCFVV